MGLGMGMRWDGMDADETPAWVPVAWIPSPLGPASSVSSRSARSCHEITTKYDPAANESTANGRPDVREIRGTRGGGGLSSTTQLDRLLSALARFPAFFRRALARAVGS